MANSDSDFRAYAGNWSSSTDSDGGENNSFVRKNIVEDGFSFVAIVASHSFSIAQSIDRLNFLQGTIF